jgi:hypothetical protein
MSGSAMQMVGMLVFLAVGLDAASATGGREMGVRYLNEPRTHQILVSGDRLSIAAVAQPEEYTWSAAVRDCSDDQFICLEAEPLVFALPLGPLSLHRAYVKEGIRFEISECDGSSCKNATVSAACEAHENGRCRVDPTSSPPPHPSFIFSFRYEEERGVVSINLSQVPKATQQPFPSEYFLVGRKGILADAQR